MLAPNSNQPPMGGGRLQEKKSLMHQIVLKAKCDVLGKLNFLLPVVKCLGTQVLCVGSLVSD